MRVVFVGASRFGLRCLDALRRIPACEVVGVVTAPQVFPISYRPEGVRNVLFADLKSYAGEHALLCEMIGAAGMRDSALLARVSAWRPAAFVVAGWYHLVPKSWRAVAPAYGLHASLLPDYSGGAPLVWAIINGESRTGITFFQFADGVDNGPVVSQAATEIRAEDTIATVYERVERLGVALLQADLPRLAAGTAQLRAQDESRRRVFPQRSPEDGLIDWTRASARIHDFVRAQTKPYPGAFAILGGHRVTVWAARPGVTGQAARPGAWRVADGRVFMGCGDETELELTALGVNGADVTPAAFGRQLQLMEEHSKS